MTDDARFVFRWDDLPTATPDLPGCGGTIRVEARDFEVTELPSYLPQGKGSHRYALVRKTDLTTRDLVRVLQDAGVKANQIGVAGLKDKYAVTTQWLSVPNKHESAFEALSDVEGVEILETSRHKNKLGMGHLRGNHFRIRIRAAEPGGVANARAVLARLEQVGAPNFFGPQRFGRFGRNAVDGLKLLKGEWVPGDHRLKRFFSSALQSMLFNHLLKLRMERDLYRRVLVGDWAKKHDTGGMFLVEDAGESARAERMEISATLPLYGTRVRVSDGVPGELETAVLERFGLRWPNFTSRRGDRRISRVALEAIEATEDEEGVLLSFALPKGSYATTVLREVMKVDVDEPTEPGGSAEQTDADRMAEEDAEGDAGDERGEGGDARP